MFNEKSHAFIPAKFHFYLTEFFGERGKNAFIHATQHYAAQRGRRMAQRAIRDGQPLDSTTYHLYGEWLPTPELALAKEDHVIESKSIDPYEIHVFRCPWHVQFAEMGLTEAGKDYCDHLDEALYMGFNPKIEFKVLGTLFTDKCCVHRINNSGLEKIPEGRKKYVEGFEYHCAHSYWTYSEVAAAIFGKKGEEVSSRVLKDFSEAYGQKAADRLVEYKHTNFNIIGSA